MIRSSNAFLSTASCLRQQKNNYAQNPLHTFPRASSQKCSLYVCIHRKATKQQSSITEVSHAPESGTRNLLFLNVCPCFLAQFFARNRTQLYLEQETCMHVTKIVIGWLSSAVFWLALSITFILSAILLVPETCMNLY